MERIFIAHLLLSTSYDESHQLSICRMTRALKNMELKAILKNCLITLALRFMRKLSPRNINYMLAVKLSLAP